MTTDTPLSSLGMATRSHEADANQAGISESPVDGADVSDRAPRRTETNTSEHTGLLEVFKANLIQASLYRPASDEERASHDDTTLMSVRPPFLHSQNLKSRRTPGAFCERAGMTSTRQRCNSPMQRPGESNTTSTNCSRRSTPQSWSRPGNSIPVGLGAETTYVSALFSISAIRSR